MRQKVVVVVPPSQSKQFSCWNCHQPSSSLPFCEFCQSLKSLPEGLTHFEILGVAPSLKTDPEKLRERFYGLSKLVHPDKFATKSGPEAMYSGRWSTAINKAYQVLRHPTHRAEYLLEQNGISPLGKAPVPVDLAETYFDLQDLLQESGDPAQMKVFQDELECHLTAAEESYQRLAEEWESGSEDKQKLLQKLFLLLNRRRYLESMLSDLRRKLG